MTISYTTGIPAANNDPSVDQPNMQTNNDNIAAIIEVDHYGFNAASNTPGGQHQFVTFPATQAYPSLTPNTSQFYPRIFGTATTFLETYFSANMSNGQQIDGYIPFVKAMFSVTTTPTGPFPATLHGGANTQAINIASIVQTSTTSIIVTFTTALAYNTYYVFSTADSQTGLSFTKTTTTLTVAGNFTINPRTLALMVM